MTKCGAPSCPGGTPDGWFCEECGNLRHEECLHPTAREEAWMFGFTCEPCRMKLYCADADTWPLRETTVQQTPPPHQTPPQQMPPPPHQTPPQQTLPQQTPPPHQMPRQQTPPKQTPTHQMPLHQTQPQPTLPLQTPPPTSPPPADQWIAVATSGNIVSETTHCETAESTPYHAVVIAPPPPTPPPPTAVKAHSGLTRCEPAVLPRPPEDKTTQDHLEELPRRRRPPVLRKLLARNGFAKRRFCNTLKGISHLSSHSQSTRRHLHPSHVPLKALPHRRGPPRAPPGARRRLTQKAPTPPPPATRTTWGTTPPATRTTWGMPPPDAEGANTPPPPATRTTWGTTPPATRATWGAPTPAVEGAATPPPPATRATWSA
ncbi:basic proline-rich protein-like [Bacillus rossius redtenbacheri]|uniref:basic proline-rich protein-like n=1 Tax=Bacillus rossius redtenbacheri TaxID=93214 RepID=UPI002FDD5B7E